MKNTTFQSVFLLFILISCFSCKELEFKPSHESTTEEESKARKVFVASYVIDKPDLNGVEFSQAWIEKAWGNELKDGVEVTNIADSTLQIIISFKTKDLFSKKIYWDKILIKDLDSNVMSSYNGILFLGLRGVRRTPESLKLYVIESSGKLQSNLDNKIIDSLILTKR